ncbi:MAG TPA: biotin--[acetyl-CoA-carboxylase] ligase [Acidimicrobiales bacterium]|nr:biotin--[acetyl-CoA-carboxylase] ligase [Acidimicrobiales bacterium]
MSPPGSWAVHRLGTVGSTNTYVSDLARQGAPAGLVAVADHQTAGRGRLGRRWEAPPGTSLLLSVLLRPVLDPAQLHLCTAAVALAAAAACRSVAGSRPDHDRPDHDRPDEDWPDLKWPNDLLLDGRKLAGVLAEADPAAPGGPPGSVAVVVGIGLNVDWSGPPGAGGTCLAEHAGRPVDREALLQALLTELGPRVEALDSAEGRHGLAAELRRRCRTLGQPVRVDLPDGSIDGTAVDLTDDGHLVVDTAAGRRTVAAGDVVHLRPSGGGPAAN